MPGYPDYRAYPQWRTDNLFPAFSQVLTPGAHPVGPIPMVGNQAVQVRAKVTAGYGTVTIAWFLDSAMTQSVGADPFDVNTETTLAAILPVKGPYLKLNINVTSGVNMNVQTYAAGINNASGRIYYPLGRQLIYQAVKSLAASGVDRFPLPFICKGIVCVSFTPSDALGLLRLETWQDDASGAAVKRVADLGAPVALANMQAAVVDSIFSLRITNLDAGAAHSYAMSMALAGDE